LSEIKSIIVDDKAFKEYLAQAIKTLNNVRPLLRRLGARLKKSTEDNFTSEGRPAWKPLARTTLMIRRLKKCEGPILRRKGRLARSVRTVITNESVSLTTNLKYAALQQFGGTVNHPGGTRYHFYGDSKIRFVNNKRKGYLGGITRPHRITVPARPFLSTTQEDVDDMAEITKEFITGAL
jgi:phage gpG-like protein